MDNNKYQSITPENDDYKITSQDIVEGKNKKKKKKKGNGALKVLTALVLILALLVGGGAVFVNSYLSKMNYGDSKGEVSPELDKEEALVFDEQVDADADIHANLNDNVLWYDDRIYNVLLVGVDYGENEKVMFEGMYLPRSDSMILLSINTIDNVINMVSLSRAVYVAIPGHGNKRLNTAHAYGGAKTLIETIEQNYKIRIDKYVTVDLSGFEQIIDILGGVKIEMTAQEASYILGKYQAGTYNLDGETAAVFPILRKIDSDRKRTGRQRAVLNAIAQKLKGSSVTTLFNLLDDVLPLVTTNFTKTELISQATNAPKYLSMQIKEDIIPHNATSLTMRDGKEVLILDWDETKSYIHDLLYPGIIPQSAEQEQ